MKKYLLTTFLTLFLIFPDTIHAKWWAEAKCSLESIKETTRHLHGKTVYGNGTGKTRDAAAEKAVIKDVNDNNVPMGKKAKHCRITEAFKQKRFLDFLPN